MADDARTAVIRVLAETYTEGREELILDALRYDELVAERAAALKANGEMAYVWTQNETLRQALIRAREDMAGWGAYASPYFQEKWDLPDDLAAIDAVLASTSTQEESGG